MSNKFENSADSRCKLSQRGATSRSDDTQNDALSDAQTCALSGHGPVNLSSSEAAQSQPDASADSSAARDALATDEATRAALIGEPDAASDLRWCSVCKALVRPVGKGRCERCKKFLRLNFVARRHPVNVLRRDALLANLLNEFPPANILERATCERLAGAMEQLEAIKPGSPDWQRLVQMEQTLAASLHDARLSREVRTPTDCTGLTNDALVERAEALLTSAKEIRDDQRRRAAAVATAPSDANDAGAIREDIVPTAAAPGTRLSDDERQERISVAALRGDVEHVKVLQENKE